MTAHVIMGSQVFDSLSRWPRHLGNGGWTMASREVPLPLGEIGWLFPTLADRAEHERVRQLLDAADEVLYRLGQRLGAQPDARLWNVLLNRFYYQRLGPEPDFPITILAGEGGADRICVEVVLTPAGLVPFHKPGPPWQIHTTVFLQCDSADPGCGRGHLVDARTSPLVETPIAAALEVQAATAWLLQRLADETEESLRTHDPDRGHPPTPRRLD
jgi:hypothetical protein